MYRVECDYGTRQIVWGMRSALEWMTAAGPNARIVGFFTGRELRTRTQTRVY